MNYGPNVNFFDAAFFEQLDEDPMSSCSSHYNEPPLENQNKKNPCLMKEPELAPKTQHVEATLVSRDKEYGDYERQCELVQRVKGLFFRHPGFDNLPCYQKESIEMIITKLARIVNRGDGTKNKDSWHDICGYATLVENKL